MIQKYNLAKLLTTLAALSALVPSALICVSNPIQRGQTVAYQIFNLDARPLAETIVFVTCLGALSAIGTSRLRRAHLLWLISYTVILIAGVWANPSSLSVIGILLVDIAASLFIFASVVLLSKLLKERKSRRRSR